MKTIEKIVRKEDRKKIDADFSDDSIDVADIEDYLSSELSRIDKYVFFEMAKQLFRDIFRKGQRKRK